MSGAVEQLVNAASACYADAGPFHSRFARGKLRHDPMYSALFRLGCLPDRGALADLGCGRGLLLAVIAAAREQYRKGVWPTEWPPPPSQLRLTGYDINPRHAAVAQRALDGRAQVTLLDVREAILPPTSAIALLDVLLYLEPDEQRTVLRHAASALENGGVLLVREADAACGLAFHMTRWSERVLEAFRGRPFSRLNYRSTDEWAGLLRSLGLSVRAEPMSEGTPFANVLFICTKRT